MLTLRRFRALASTYGANLRRWPAAARVDTEALLQQSARARATLAAEERLDAAIDLAVRREAIRLERGLDSAAALEQLRLAVAAQIRRPPRQVARLEPARVPVPGWFRAHLPELRRLGLATAACAAVAAGLLVGARYDAAARSGDLLAALSFNPMQTQVD
ncbi:MAG: hypothetical protein ACYDAE_08610 [Steroidobacteraceae bacterium]